jgi:lysophospholipase L1-like esterase
MKTILCYGDSNTWGYDPLKSGRYPKEKIWTTILQKKLGSDFEVIPEGLNGRTTVWDDPVEGEYRNGKKYLLPCLHTHKPIDLVILFLGGNDLKYRFSVTAEDVAKGVGALVDIIRKSETGPNMKSPEILVLIPPPAKELENFPPMFLEAVNKSRIFPKVFPEVLNRMCKLMDTSKIIESSEIDGIHLDPESHKILGEAVADYIRENIF